MTQFQTKSCFFRTLKILTIFLLLSFPGFECAMGNSLYFPLWQEGQIIDTKTATTVTFNHLQSYLIGAEVIYIGEEHHNPHHIQAALRILEALREGGKQPVLGMEMFGWDGQVALDRYIQDALYEKKQFLVDAQWESNWEGNFADYEPLVNYAKMHSLPLYGMIPPRSLVRKVVTQGLAQTRQDPERIKWGFDQDISLDDPDYHRVLFQQIEQCHPGIPDKMYKRFYEASIFKDEGMAKIIVDAINTHAPQGGPVVSYTGGGHVQYHVPIPTRVKREKGDSLRQVSVYLNAFDPARKEEIRQSIQDRIADYIWLTPLGPKGPQPRCG